MPQCFHISHDTKGNTSATSIWSGCHTQHQIQSDWDDIRNQKQRLIQLNNQRENAKRIEHKYKQNDKVLLIRDDTEKYAREPYEGPYVITETYDNGTMEIRKGSVLQQLNIWLLKPYHD